MLACHPARRPIAITKLSAILTQLQLAEAYVQYVAKDSNRHGFSKDDSLKKYTLSILHEQGVTEESFRYSLNWYTRHPDLLDSAYQQVLSGLSILQTRNQ